jgi:hypothetical protein
MEILTAPRFFNNIGPPRLLKRSDVGGAVWPCGTALKAAAASRGTRQSPPVFFC